MSDDDRSWTIEHFSLGNPYGPGQEDVPALLPKVALSIESLRIESLGPVDIQDVVFHSNEINEHGVLPHMTVYFSRAPDAPGRLRPA